MKWIRICALILFCAFILTPLVFFDWREEAISEIDNRMLAPNPLKAEGDKTQAVEAFISDRIGFRDRMILAYTVLNDRLFGKMEHPSYSYGKDGYVFGAGITTYPQYGSYHEDFAHMLQEIQEYCEEREIPFLFVFNPAKPAVYSEYIADGVNYDRSWVDLFLADLDSRGIRYLDQTKVLREWALQGEQVFNVKYDANHWNDLGAYYACNAMLEELRKDLPGIHVNTPEDVEIGKKKETSLMVSQFPIDEDVPQIRVKTEVQDLTAAYYYDVALHPSYPAFGYYRNEARCEQGAPRALVFQGSYMNSYGQKFLQNAFSEYIYVHDYQNVMAIPYYMNLFEPDCVIFEVAEYTLNETYFTQENMHQMDLQPVCGLQEYEQAPAAQPMEAVLLNQGEKYTTLALREVQRGSYAWLVSEDGHMYDTVWRDDQCTLGIRSELLNQNLSILLRAADGTWTRHPLLPGNGA